MGCVLGTKSKDDRNDHGPLLRGGEAKLKAVDAAGKLPNNAVRAGASQSCNLPDSAGDSVELQKTIKFLSHVELFKSLKLEVYRLIATRCEPVDFKEGEIVITEGDIGDAFFLIMHGIVSVSVNNRDGATRRLAKLSSGDYFGEASLLRDEPRTATITALTSLETLKMSRESFDQLRLRETIKFPRRKAVMVAFRDEADVEDRKEEVSTKTKAERALLAKALRSNERLARLYTLTSAQVAAMIDAAWKETVMDGHNIIVEGDPFARYFYVVQTGTFHITATSPQREINWESEGISSLQVEFSTGSCRCERSSKTSTRLIKTVEAGGSFGELALLYNVPRAATVQAHGNAVVWVIDGENFRRILKGERVEKCRAHSEYLRSIPCLECLCKEERELLCPALHETHFAKNEILFEEKAMADVLYIICEGDVCLTRQGHRTTTVCVRPNLHAYLPSCLAECSYFQKRREPVNLGTSALFPGQLHMATATVVSKDGARVIMLRRGALEHLFGPLQDIIERRKTQSTENGAECRTSSPHGKSFSGPGGFIRQESFGVLKNVEDLDTIGLLGCGTFGVVELCGDRKSRRTFARKNVSKGYVVSRGLQARFLNERNIMRMTNSQFIIKLYQTFNSEQMLYFLMEVALGGEMYETYHRKGFHGSLPHALFYTGSVAIALEHLHDRHIIYRDLKLENILLDARGHVKVTDMGLAKCTPGVTYTTCGTPDYFAPEMIRQSGHTVAVDWWCFGVVVFEMMAGWSPFEAADPMNTYERVLQGIDVIKCPPACQGETGTFIKLFLKNEPQQRLPMRPAGMKGLMEHPWYHGFKWQKLEDSSLDPPYLPKVSDERDMSNFKPNAEDLPDMIQYVPDGSGWDAHFQCVHIPALSAAITIKTSTTLTLPTPAERIC